MHGFKPAVMFDISMILVSIPNFIVHIIAIHFISYLASFVDKDGHFVKM